MMPGHGASDQTEVDVVVVGAGFAGLYALHKLRGLGFVVRVLEAGSGVGGTWFWNRYPGARCDVPSLEYSYSFSPELERDWEWTEYFPAQDEIERYLNHVADRFDLRRDIELDTSVTAATFDEDADRWLVDTDRGDRWSARFLVMATGCLSVPTRPDLEGLETFRGRVLQTSRWPADVDLSGARIALIGTGSSGVQAAPELAAIAEHLYVLQRTPTFTYPSPNGPLDPDLQASVKARYREMRDAQRASMGGVSGFGGIPIITPARPDHSILDASDEELEAALDEYGFSACRVWNDIASDPAADARARELYCEMVRRTVRDPETAEALSPSNYPIFCKRPVLDIGYFEMFNRPNVTLVDLRKGDIERVTPTGIRTAHGDLDVDVIVFATGFDAMTGALTRIDIRGRDGRLLRDEWKDGPRTLLGLQVAGFPNLFTITGPGSPSVLSNMVPGVEHHVDWIAECLVHLRAHELRTIEPTSEAQDAWSEHVVRTAAPTMYASDSCNSWYLGANVPGKPRVFMVYLGGFPTYIAECQEIVDAGYRGFVTA
jgi:cation diffusion facilitator CzcD-associated flavoprotein CzcO